MPTVKVLDSHILTIEPEGLVTSDIEQWARDNTAALEVESIGAAGHHAPEDQPDAIGHAIANWLTRHQLTKPQPIIR
ncbi:MAG: haloalkane dehalogenase [Actinomycetia bacterium]|nr:haloalkane dehalogenase [Actinomycetes bacterium]